MQEISKGYIKADIIAAKQAIDYFDENKIKDIKNIAAYHLQQASEKLIKHQIYDILEGEKINHKEMYVHSLDRLINYAESKGLELNIPEYVDDNRLVISEWESGSCYRLGFSIRIDTLKKAYDIIYNWYKEYFQCKN